MRPVPHLGDRRVRWHQVAGHLMAGPHNGHDVGIDGLANLDRLPQTGWWD